MQLWEVLLISVALAADAFAVSLTNGMVESKMKLGKMCLIAATFGIFQFLMPVIGYYCGYAFAKLIEKIAPWLSFAILVIIGGKMLVDCFLEWRKKRKTGGGQDEKQEKKPLGLLKLLIQAVATSIDALAVGVTFFACDTTSELPMPAMFCFVCIGVVTFLLSMIALAIGKKAGDKFADKAEIFGGVVLVAIGIKILLEGIL